MFGLLHIQSFISFNTVEFVLTEYWQLPAAFTCVKFNLVLVYEMRPSITITIIIIIIKFDKYLFFIFNLLVAFFFIAIQ